MPASKFNKKEYDKKRYEENKEAKRAAMRQYYCNNLKRFKEYREKHKERRSAYRNRWARTTAGRWKTAKSRAPRLDLVFSLTLQQYSNLITKPCHYCAKPIAKSGVGLDRINSNKGYIKGNVVPCCTICNKAKNDLTVKAFKKQIVSIYKHWASK